MSSYQERLRFSQRLQKALKILKYPNSPTYIANEFNRYYHGQSISVQTANNWLQGKAIPNQDKLIVLAKWLEVSIQWLRFGEEGDMNEKSNISSDNLAFLSKFNKLNKQQKKIIISLIDEIITSV